MSTNRRTFTPEFKADAVQLVVQGRRPIAQVARELEINESSLGYWVKTYRAQHPDPETAPPAPEALRIAQQPPDADHPFGHHKAEYFSAVLEGALIVIAAVLILHEAWGAFRDPRVIEAPWTGLAINLGAGVLNGIWCWVLLREGRA